MISIPTPCHEDFTKMTKTERGAFCQKCQIDTYDFKQLSANEIKSVLLKEKGNHICGQLNQNQISELNASYLVWRNNRPRTFQSRFIFALLLVFGLSLFSCENGNAQMLGEIEIIQELGRIEIDSTYINAQIMNEDTINLVEYLKEGPIDSVPKIEAPQQILSGVPAIETIEPEPTFFLEGEIEMNIAGGMVAPDNFYHYLEDTLTSYTLPTLNVKELRHSAETFELFVNPNPVISDAQLIFYLAEEKMIEINVFSLTGAFVKTLYQGELMQGEQDISFNLSDLSKGTYIIAVKYDDKVGTKTILKK